MMVFFCGLSGIVMLAVFITISKSYHCSTSPEYVKVSSTDCPWPNIRLPTKYRPDHYVLNLRPNLTTDLFHGNVAIKLYSSNLVSQNIAPEDDWVVLHSKDLTILSVQIGTDDGKPRIDINQDDWQFCTEKDLLAVKIPIIEGNFSLHLHYVGNISENLVGLYRSSYIAEDGKTKRSMAITHFEPTDARRMVPCLDEPSFKAHFTTSIVREPSMISLSNSPLAYSSPVTVDGIELVEDTFEKTVKMSTYLLAVAVCDYKNVSAKSTSGVTVSVFAPPHQIDLTAFALNVSVRALEYFENFFGIPYPLKKLDLISINDFEFGAMENWGLMTFRDIYLLYDPAKATVASTERVLAVIVHEIAHQWFGNLVTMNWWSDLWLNEGFANFLQYFASDALQPSWNIMSSFVSHSVESAQALDGLMHTHPVSFHITDPSEIGNMFDEISYSKGSALIMSLTSVMTVAEFKRALKDYLTAYQYSNAEEENLWQYLNQHSKNVPAELTVADYMSNYTKQGGYPLVEVKIDHDGKLTASQSRFYYLTTEMDNPSAGNNQTWHIPLTIRSDKSDTVSTHWILKQKRIVVDTNINGDVAWYKANVDKIGFYRVNYDADNWRALFKAVGSDPTILGTLDRISLLSDARAMLRVGKLKFGCFFDFLRQLVAKETSRGVWDLLYSEFRFMEQILRGSDIYSAFVQSAANIIEPLYLTYDWSRKFNVDEYDLQFVQTYVRKLACLFSVGDCRSRAADNFKLFVNEGKEMHPDFRYLYCSRAVAQDSDFAFDKAFDLYNRSTVPAEKRDYLLCLASTNSLWLLSKLLNMTLDPNIIKQPYIFIILGAIIREQQTGTIDAWQFFKQNYQYFKKTVSSVILSRIMKCFSTFSTQFDYDQFVQQFHGETLTATKPAYEQTLERIKIRIQYMALNERSIIAYFEKTKVPK